MALPEQPQHGSAVDLAIAAWIAAKFGRTGSEETRSAYHRVIHEFRMQVRAAAMDLDAADLRQVRQHVLDEVAQAEMLADALPSVDSVDSVESTDATASWIVGSSDQAPGTADPSANAVGIQSVRAELRRTVDLQTRIDEEVARREAALALAAQAYAAQPPRRAVRRARVDTHTAPDEPAEQRAQVTGDMPPVPAVLEGATLVSSLHNSASSDTDGAPRRAVAPTTYNRRLAIISSFYSYALRHDLLRGRTNPISRVERRPAEAYAAARPLSYAALRRDLAQFTSDQPADLRDRALLLVGLHTGHRLSELWRMRLEHLTIAADTIEIFWPYCKGGKTMRSTLPCTAGAEGVAGRALLAWIEYLSRYTARYRAQGTSQPAAVPGGKSDTKDAEHASNSALRDVQITSWTGSHIVMPLSMPPEPMSQGARRDWQHGQMEQHHFQRRTRLQQSRDTRQQQQHEGPLWINLARNAAGLRPISKRTIATICGERLGTTKVHSLRHTFARTLEDAGVKVSEIQQILGHQDLGTTGRYLARLRTQHIPHLDRVAELYGLGE